LLKSGYQFASFRSVQLCLARSTRHTEEAIASRGVPHNPHLFLVVNQSPRIRTLYFRVRETMISLFANLANPLLQCRRTTPELRGR